MDVEADVAYGDGTPEWLGEAMEYTPRNSWLSERDYWHAARPSWPTAPPHVGSARDLSNVQ